MYIFRASITLRDGSKIYARDYGKRAFKIYIGGKDKKKKQVINKDLGTLSGGLFLFCP